MGADPCPGVLPGYSSSEDLLLTYIGPQIKIWFMVSKNPALTGVEIGNTRRTSYSTSL